MPDRRLVRSFAPDCLPKATAWTGAWMQHALDYRGRKYFGRIPADRHAGRGIFRSQDGDFYDGEYARDCMHGFSVHTLANGDVYCGEYKGGEKEGHGTYTGSDKGHYCGQWKGDKRDGYGAQTFADKDVYWGQWKEDKRDGYGVLRARNGGIYCGQWKGDEKEGHAIHRWTDKSIYCGQYKGGQRERGVNALASGERTFDLRQGGRNVSVPFDAVNPEHAAMLREANDAEARRDVSVLLHRLERSAHFASSAGASKSRRKWSAACRPSGKGCIGAHHAACALGRGHHGCHLLLRQALSRYEAKQMKPKQTPRHVFRRLVSVVLLAKLARITRICARSCMFSAGRPSLVADGGAFDRRMGYLLVQQQAQWPVASR